MYNVSQKSSWLSKCNHLSRKRSVFVGNVIPNFVHQHSFIHFYCLCGSGIVGQQKLIATVNLVYSSMSNRAIFQLVRLSVYSCNIAHPKTICGDQIKYFIIQSLIVIICTPNFPLYTTNTLQRCVTTFNWCIFSIKRKLLIA